QPGIAQDAEGFVQFRVGWRFARAGEIFLLQPERVEPGSPRFAEEREVIGHAEKLSPQEQCATAFGLVTLKPPFCRSSLKSRTDPLTNSALLGSTTIRTLYD